MIKLLAILGLIVGASASAQAPTIDDFVETRMQEVLDYNCGYLKVFYGVTCPRDLEPPVVVISNVVSPLYYGFYYKGEKYIFVSTTSGVPKQIETIFHETMHYAADWSEAGFNRCMSEEVARRATALRVGKKYDDSWREQYRCTKDNKNVPRTVRPRNLDE